MPPPLPEAGADSECRRAGQLRRHLFRSRKCVRFHVLATGLDRNSGGLRTVGEPDSNGNQQKSSLFQINGL